MAPAGLLDPRLSAYASSRFDLDTFAEEQLDTLSEKGIRALATELATLRQATSAEMQRSVFANYSAFIRTAKEIADLQSELSRSRAILSGMSAVLTQLREPAGPDALAGASTPERGVRSLLAFDLATPAPTSTAATEALTELTELLEVHTAEGRLDAALVTLERATRHLAAAQREQEESAFLGDEHPGSSLGAQVARQRVQLAALLAEAVAERSTPTGQRRAAAQGLVRLGEGGRAYELMLAHHSAMLAAALRPLCPPRREDVQGMGVFTAEVSHAVCHSLAAAVQDAGAAFASEPARASSLLGWVQAGVGRWAEVLLSEGSALGCDATPREMAVAVRVALQHAQLLEPHGLAVAPLLARLVRRRVSEALEKELAVGAPGPELITAAEAYLRGGSSTQLRSVADVLVRTQESRAPAVPRVASLGSALDSGTAKR